MSALLDKVMGVFKQKSGQATGDKRLEGEGHLDQAKSHAAEAVHDVKEGVEDLSDQK